MNFTSFTLLFDALASFIISYRMFRSYRRQWAMTYKIYSFLGFIMGISFISYGFFPLFAPENGLLLEYGYIAGTIALSVTFALFMWFIAIILKYEFLSVALPVIAIVIGITNMLLSYLSGALPYIGDYGVIHYNQIKEVNILFAGSLGLLIFPAGVMFALSPLVNIRLRIRSVLLGLGLVVASVAGMGVFLSSYSVIIFASFIFINLGYIFMVISLYIPVSKEAGKEGYTGL